MNTRRDPTSAQLGMLDVETTPITPKLSPINKFWGLAIEGEDYRRFDSTDELTHFLSQRARDDLRLYHWHDYEVCQAIRDYVLPQRMIMRGGRVLRCEVEGVPWVNGYALFPTALAKLLKTFGYKKKPLNAGHEPECDGGSEKDPCSCPNQHELFCPCSACDVILKERNHSDCVEGLDSLLKAGQAYEQAIGFDPVRNDVTTAAKAAMMAAEMMAGPIPVYTERREAYRGGRTEAFRLWDCGTARCYDIKSSYPASFVDLPDSDYLIHAAVKVPASPAPMPFFREADRSEGLLFPAGEFDTWVFQSTYERYIMPHFPGCVRRIYEKIPVDFSWMKACVPLVEHGYALKQKGGALAYPAKILLNAFYGRMGLKPEATIAYISGDLPRRDNTHFALPSGGYYVFEKVPREIRQGANYLFAAAVCDNARGRLLDGMMKTGAALYGDTDSIFVPDGTTSLPGPLGDKLGQWEDLGTGQLYIRTVKDYEFAGTTKLKGGKRSKTWTVRLALGRKPVRDVKRRRGEDSRYSKRRVLSDGSTMPLVFRE